ncbi:MAG: arsenic metallochaperone ArsD family protein [Desulfuromonadales bacterium]|nr:arsenic metallochaperone ArsD family protein [Desulfuromonadales bacterium]MDW7757373.1 arsenic metallochaperone ArsD family protein [Desulfuromonadales bacterium]
MNIEIFAPARILSAGTDGGSAKPELEWWKRNISLLRESGMDVQIYTLDTDAIAYAAHAGVADLLLAEGGGVLPATFIDGKLTAKRRYLSAAELEREAAVRGVRFTSGEKVTDSM